MYMYYISLSSDSNNGILFRLNSYLVYNGFFRADRAPSRLRANA